MSSIADSGAHEAVALVGELDAIILEMDVANMRRDSRGEVERRFGDRKCVAGVETDADAAPRLAESNKLVAAEILVVLDRKGPAFVRRSRAIFAEGPSNI